MVHARVLRAALVCQEPPKMHDAYEVDNTVNENRQFLKFQVGNIPPIATASIYQVSICLSNKFYQHRCTECFHPCIHMVTLEIPVTN